MYEWQQVPVGCVEALHVNSTSEIYNARPFHHECLNYAELALMTAVGLSALVAFIVLISNLVLYQRMNNYREMHNPQRCTNISHINGDIPINNS